MITKEVAYDVFLSHRALDKPRVRRIAQRLHEAGLRVWFDEWTIQPGDDIYLAIERGLEQSRTLVLCLSRAAVESDWVSLERSTALFRDPGNADRRFVPLLLEDTPLPDTLRRYRHIDYRREDQAAFDELLAACRGSAAAPARSGKQPTNPAGSRSRSTKDALERAAPIPPSRQTDPPTNRLREHRAPPRTAPFALVAMIAFAAALLILLLMLYQADTLVHLGLVGNLYYLILVPLGLSVAAVLFGLLRSHAIYAGHVGQGKLELGGPIVGFLLVLIFGFWLVPNPHSFALTVFVHGEAGPQDVPLRNQGAVLLDLGADRRREAIGEKGQAYFPGIPATFRGHTVRALVEAEGYELAKPEGTVTLSGDGVYLAVRPKAVRLSGYVKGPDGQPVSNATVSLAGHIAKTDPSGFFGFTRPGGLASENVTLQVRAPGFAAWQGHVVPGGSEITVQLQKAQ